MITLRPGSERGRGRMDWLQSWHSFSFADYYEPAHMGLSNLRVINEDIIAPGGGFATHGHQDMEIVTYMLSGALEHRDSMGNGSVIRPGEVQYMSAGSGVRHSEFNASASEPAHLLQIWLQPNRLGVTPGYDQRTFPADQRRGRLALLVSPNGRDGSIATHQDGRIYATLLGTGESVTHGLGADHLAYVHVARGQVRVDGETLSAGDAARVDGQPSVAVEGLADAEVLLFDLSSE